MFLFLQVYIHFKLTLIRFLSLKEKTKILFVPFSARLSLDKCYPLRTSFRPYLLVQHWDWSMYGMHKRVTSVWLLADVEDVKFVINFDYPSSSEDYIHRIGRTGRSLQTGTAYAFFTPHNAKHAFDLISVLREANQVVNPKLSEMAEMAKSGGFQGRGG